MAKTHGKNGVIQIKPDLTGALAAIGEIKKFTLETSCETVDTKVLSSEWDAHIPGLKSWTVSAECHFDSADAQQAILSEGTSVDVALMPLGNVSTRIKLTGTATVTACSIPVENASTVALNVTLKGNGALTRGTV